MIHNHKTNIFAEVNSIRTLCYGGRTFCKLAVNKIKIQYRVEGISFKNNWLWDHESNLVDMFNSRAVNGTSCTKNITIMKHT